MGEYADMMIEGDCCSSCGEYLGEGDGFPVVCASCELEEAPEGKRRARLGGLWKKIAIVIEGSPRTEAEILEAVAAGEESNRAKKRARFSVPGALAAMQGAKLALRSAAGWSLTAKGYEQLDEARR